MHTFNPPPLDSDQKIRKKQILQAATSLLPYGVKINLKICTQNKFKKKNKRPKFLVWAWSETFKRNSAADCFGCNVWRWNISRFLISYNCPRGLFMLLCYRGWGSFTNSFSSPVPELFFLPAPYKSWTRASERRVQDNLHARAQNAAIFYPQIGGKTIFGSTFQIWLVALFSE